MRALVCGISPELPPCRRTHAETRDVSDHSTINRWVVKYSPQLEQSFHRRKRPVWVSWRMDETYIKVKGQLASGAEQALTAAEQFYAMAA
jgi:transposase-like protein